MLGVVAGCCRCGKNDCVLMVLFVVDGVAVCRRCSLLFDVSALVMR